MDGWFFYYSLWSFWIVISFIVPRDFPDRFYLANFILISIILSIYEVPILYWDVNVTILMWLLSCMASLAAYSLLMRLYQICVTFIIMLVYSVFLLFELYDPIWVIIDRKWFLSMLIGTIAILMNKNVKNRMTSTIIGMGMGEFLFAYVLYTTGIKLEITTPSFLDLCSMTGMIILLWSVFEYAIHSIKKIYTPFPEIKKEKHKPG